MSVSQKCQYALRAVYELAVRYGQGPTSISDIADTQAIPPRFLELIMRELRQGGFVDSRRGVRGGYLLLQSPEAIRVGDLIRFVEGPLSPVSCMADENATTCPLRGRCAFAGMWRRALDAMNTVYDSTTFQDLIDEDRRAASKHSPNYVI